jgi:hypothetical protein
VVSIKVPVGTVGNSRTSHRSLSGLCHLAHWGILNRMNIELIFLHHSANVLLVVSVEGRVPVSHLSRDNTRPQRHSMLSQTVRIGTAFRIQPPPAHQNQTLALIGQSNVLAARLAAIFGLIAFRTTFPRPMALKWYSK